MSVQMITNAQRHVINVLKNFGFDGQRMLALAPRLAEVRNLDKCVEFWSTTLLPETIDGYPELLYIKPQAYTMFYNNFTKVFGNDDVNRVLNRNPQLLLEEWPQLYEKTQFAVLTMKAHHKEIVYSNYLTYPFSHILTRYEFLWRSGVYVKPHKNDKKRSYVIPLKVIVESDISEILKISGLSTEEYVTLRALIDKELELQASANLPDKIKQIKEKGGYYKKQEHRLHELVDDLEL